MNGERFILGVCGYLGSGKSEVLKILKRHGWFVVDADEVVHNMYEAGGAGQRKIADFFGDEFLRSDGSVNRPKLRKVVFEDVKKLKILNALIHPLVFSEIQKILDQNDADRVVIEAAYFEKKYLGSLVDKIMLIERDHEDVRKFEGIDIIPDKVDARVKNNSTLNDLEKKVIIEVEKLIH